MKIELTPGEYKVLCEFFYECKPHLMTENQRQVIRKIIKQDKLDRIVNPNQIDLEDAIFQAEIEQNDNTNQLGLNL
jgi:hypothetical protein